MAKALYKQKKANISIMDTGKTTIFYQILSRRIDFIFSHHKFDMNYWFICHLFYSLKNLLIYMKSSIQKNREIKDVLLYFKPVSTTFVRPELKTYKIYL